MELKPIVDILSSQPLSVKKIISQIDKFVDQQAQETSNLSLTNRDRKVVASDDVVQKLTIIREAVFEFQNREKESSKKRKKELSPTRVENVKQELDDSKASNEEKKKTKKKKKD